MINVAVENDEVIKALEALAEQFPERVKEALLNAGLAIEAQAKSNISGNETGDLRRSITTTLDDEGLGVSVGSNLEYAPYVHEGTGIYAPNGRQEVPWVYYDERRGSFFTTKGRKPNPFLEDAINALSSQLTDYFKGILE